jgi:hypothetical protein
MAVEAQEALKVREAGKNTALLPVVWIGDH